MKKKLLFIMLLISITTFSQINFENAYFISDSGERIECKIKNFDWKNTPNSFEYKINEGDNPIVKTLSDVQLFEIYNHSKYVKATVKFDQYSNNLNHLSNTRNPNFIEKQSFFKEIVSGNINLYTYTEGNTVRFYYKIGDDNLEPLIYKPYELQLGSLYYNEDYKKQLEKILVCPSISSNEIMSLKYKEKNLTELITKYNNCNNQNTKEKLISKKRDKFNINIRPRINFHSVEYTNLSNNRNVSFDNKIGFGLGLELEFILPFNNNKWAIILEPTYLSYKSEKSIESNEVVGGKYILNINYKALEIPFGLRHYMFLNENSKLFIDGQVVYNVNLNSSFDIKRVDGSELNSFSNNSSANFQLGFGYNYKNKYGVQVKFFTNKDITKSHLLQNSEYKSISLIFSYNIF